MASSRLELEGLKRHFGAVRAVDDVDLVVENGEFLTLLGPSGSGKTTILRLVAGFEHPNAGKILIDGVNVSSLSPARRGIGVVFQHYALFPHMTVAENVAYGLKMRGVRRSSRDSRVSEMLDLVDLAGYGDRYPRQLSGGQQQRIAVARALAPNPALMLMDEPLGALDRALRTQVEEELRRLHKETGTTIVYVTHDQEEALALSDRIGVMRGGRLVQVGRAETLYEEPIDDFVAGFFGDCNLLPVEPRSTVRDGTAEVALAGTPLIARTMTEQAAVVLAVRPERVRLEARPGDVELQLRVRDYFYLGHVLRVTAEHPVIGRVVARIDPRAAPRLEIDGVIPFHFSPSDAVVVARSEA